MREPLDLPQAVEEPTRTRPRIVQDFRHASRTARSMAQLRGLMCGAAWALGFHHLLLQGASGQVWLAGLPPGWTAVSPASGDAVLAVAMQSYAPFLWSDISRLVMLSQPQRDFLD